MQDRDSHYLSIGERRHGRFVDLPVDARLKVRIGRSIANALVSPARGLPTLRRSVRAVATALRTQGFTEEGIRARLELLIQSIALADHHDATSVISGKPRWQELSERVAEWLAAERGHD